MKFLSHKGTITSGNGRRWEAIDNRLKYEEDPPRYHAEKQIKGQGSGGKDVAAFLMPD